MKLKDCLETLAHANDAQAWELLIRSIGSDVAAVCRSIIDDPDLAEDAAQQTLLQIRDHAHQFQQAGATEQGARHWILRIARTTALELLRQRKRIVQRDAKASSQRDHLASGDPVVETVQQREATQRIWREIAELPSIQRAALIMHFCEELDYQQLSRELACAKATARSHVHRGLKRIRERLAVLGCIATTQNIAEAMNRAPQAPGSSPPPMQEWQSLLQSPRPAQPLSMMQPRGAVSMLTKVSIAAAASIMLGLGSLLALNACDSDHETKNVPLVSVSPAPVPAAAGAVAETVAKPLTVTDINKDIVQFSLPTGTTVTAGALYSTTGAGGLALLNVDKVDGAQVTARIVGGSRILKVGDAVGPWSPNTAAGAATSASDAAFQVLAVRLEKRLGMASVGANLGVARRAVVYIYRDGTLIATGRVEKVYADMCSFVLDPNVTARVAVHDRLAFTPATESTVDAPNASDISEDNPF